MKAKFVTNNETISFDELNCNEECNYLLQNTKQTTAYCKRFCEDINIIQNSEDELERYYKRCIPCKNLDNQIKSAHILTDEKYYCANKCEFLKTWNKVVNDKVRRICHCMAHDKRLFAIGHNNPKRCKTCLESTYKYFIDNK